MTPPRSLSDILVALQPDPDCHDPVSVDNVLTEIGQRSFAPFVLVIAVLLVSPLSAIPGAPTLGATMIILISVQWLTRRPYMWLPKFLLRREVPGARLARAIEWLTPIAHWIDARSYRRLPLLTTPPMAMLTKVVIIGVALGWPVLELLPMVTSIGALTVAFLALGLMVRDGVLVMMGYLMVGGTAGLVIWLVTHVQG